VKALPVEEISSEEENYDQPLEPEQAD